MHSRNQNKSCIFQMLLRKNKSVHTLKLMKSGAVFREDYKKWEYHTIMTAIHFESRFTTTSFQMP